MDTETRSRNMAAIKNRNTTPELLLRRALWAAGIRGWRIGGKVFGRPDLYFPRHHVAVFVDGCFWHACPRCYQPPKSNRNFWERKIKNNTDRDKIVTQHLRDEGWQVIRLWEHDIEKRIEICVELVKESLKR